MHLQDVATLRTGKPFENDTMNMTDVTTNRHNLNFQIQANRGPSQSVCQPEQQVSLLCTYTVGGSRDGYG